MKHRLRATRDPGNDAVSIARIRAAFLAGSRFTILSTALQSTASQTICAHPRLAVLLRLVGCALHPAADHAGQLVLGFVLRARAQRRKGHAIYTDRAQPSIASDIQV